MEREELLELAQEAATHAYAPYSGFRVGAAVVVRDGDTNRVFTAANVENASYGLTLCAERAAIAAAVTAEHAGHLPHITHVAVACLDVHPEAPISHRTPCGACRQWLAELAPEATYYIDGVSGAFNLDDLLPLAFRIDNRAG